MNWYKISQHLDNEELVKRIKHTLQTHPFFIKMLDDYHIPHEDVSRNLKIVFVDLNGKFAEGNGREIRLDSSLAKGGDILDQNFHFVVHEFWHWIKRRSEEMHYFNDEEEVQSFVLGMAWEMSRGQNDSQIAKLFLPIIAGHFKDKQDARQIFMKMLEEARMVSGSQR